MMSFPPTQNESHVNRRRDLIMLLCGMILFGVLNHASKRLLFASTDRLLTENNISSPANYYEEDYDEDSTLEAVDVNLSVEEIEINEEMKLREVEINEEMKLREVENRAKMQIKDLENKEKIELKAFETCSEEKLCWDSIKKECIEGTCQCKEGWIADGGNGCQDFDECTQTGDHYPCDYEAGYCVNRSPDDGRYQCDCHEGYIGFDDNGHGPEKCILEEKLVPTEIPTASSSVPSATPSSAPSSFLPLCPLSEIEFEILSMKDIGSGEMYGGENIVKPAFEFELPKASQRLLISFDFIEKGMWDGVGIRGDQNDFVGVQLESPTRDKIDINFGGFHYGVSETMRSGNEDGIRWNVTSTESIFLKSENNEQTHHAVVEIDSTKFSYESELLRLIINYNLEGQIDEWLAIENLKINACMDTVPSVAPSAFPSTFPSMQPSLQPPALTTLTAERNALIKLYEASNGEGWSESDSWLSTTHYCEWYGVDCNSNNEVVRLDLSDNNLQGTIPAEVAAFKMLTRLGFGNNFLTGTIPTEIGELTVLEALGLHDNQLTGTIPSQIENLTSLVILWLHDNELSGSIPEVLCPIRGNIGVDCDKVTKCSCCNCW